MSHQHNLPAVLPQHPTTLPTSSPRPAPAPSPAPAASTAPPVASTRALSAVPALHDVSVVSDEGSVAAPRLRAVGTRSTHTVPATVRHAGTMTDGALALRRQAVTRLGVVSPEPAQPSALAATRAPAAIPAPSSKPATDGAATDHAPAKARTLAVAPDPSETPAESVTAPAAAPTVGPALPDARAWASRLVQAVSEVLAGDRPISQLVRFTDDVVFADLNRRVRLLGLTTTATGRGAKERSAVRSVRVCTPAKEVAEVAAHIRHGDRSRAIALRMEIRRNRWVCTALEIG
jgi:uncharacterized protein DUF6459